MVFFFLYVTGLDIPPGSNVCTLDSEVYINDMDKISTDATLVTLTLIIRKYIDLVHG
jgi:hypothetical protein